MTDIPALLALNPFDMSWIATPEAWVALLTLTVMEIVLGIDNIVFISIPREKDARHSVQDAPQTPVPLPP